MRPLTARSVPVSTAYAMGRIFPGIAVLGLCLSFAALPAAAQDTLQTFFVATNWTQVNNMGGAPDPYPIDSTSTVVIDTTTGQVASSHVTARGIGPLSLQSQQGGTGFTRLTFSGGGTDFAGSIISATFNVYLPAGSLVGYSGGPMCSFNSPCTGIPTSNEIANCTNPPPSQVGGGDCNGSLVGTFTLFSGQLSSSAANPPDFSLSVANTTASSPAGGSAIYQITVMPSNGFADTVQFSVNGLAQDSAASFSPLVITGAGSTILTISTASSTPEGRYFPTITATSGSLTHSTGIILDVTADFGVSVTPPQQTVRLGDPAKFQGTVTPLLGFNGDVSLSISGLPGNRTVEFDPAVVTGGSGSFKFTISVNSKVRPGTYTVTVTGTSGTQTSGSTITLVAQ